MTDAQELDPPSVDLTAALKSTMAAADATGLRLLLEPLPLAEALRELLQLNSIDDRAIVLSLLPSELAAAIIEEAPHEIGADLMEALDASRAVEILDVLDSDVQADLIGDMKDQEAEAILSKMDVDDAADVRRLIEYPDDVF
jgi:magnesium transporter